MNIATLADKDLNGADATGGIIKLAMLAVGGQGGGVLTDWIVALAEANGYRAQSTSVAGVAQRTGATIYYVEMAPDTGREPVFALTPSVGDVDIMIAAELMEAGRSIIRGFVTPDRTTLILSSHRILSVSEKIIPGDGRAEPDKVIARARKAAKRVVAFDMEKESVAAGSVISAGLFGALAGSGALPFPRESYEETIRASGRGVETSLAAFAACCDRAATGDEPEAVTETATGKPLEFAVEGPTKLVEAWNTLEARIGQLPEPARAMATAGLKKVVDYQDIDYGRTYLEKLEQAANGDDEEHGWRFTAAAAKYMANAMVYDDIVRVADLKLRTARANRVRAEVGVPDEAVLQVTEYFHPRAQEVCGTLPAGLGRRIENSPRLFGLLDRMINRGRRVRTDTISGYLSLWIMASLKPIRRRLLRHEVEEAHFTDWFDRALAIRADDYDLGVEILNCRRLIKGYSDTHARSLSKFDRVLSALPQLKGRPDAAEQLRALREAALAGEGMEALETALSELADESGKAE